jgi:ubiquinone/menaquinone biosynthesis C-methylase UbiE
VSAVSWKIVNPQGLEDATFKLKFELAQRIVVRAGMEIVDVGCGQGGFTAALSKAVGERGTVIGVDVCDEYVSEFWRNMEKWGLKNVVTWVQADAVALESALSYYAPDVVASYRLLEELKNCMDMPRVIRGMAKAAKKNGAVHIVEMSTQSRNEAESNYIRLHKDSGDCFFMPVEILRAMRKAGLDNVYVETVDTDAWFSPKVARQDLEFAQLWFNEEVEKSLGASIDTYGMKYPVLLLFSGVKT